MSYFYFLLILFLSQDLDEVTHEGAVIAKKWGGNFEGFQN